MKKLLSFLLCIALFITFFTSCSSEKQTVLKDKTTYMCKELDKAQKAITKVYKNETKNMTEEEIEDDWKSLAKKYEKEIGIKDGKEVKVRGYLEYVISGRTIGLLSNKDNKDSTVFVYLDEIPPEMLYIEEGEHPLIEVSGVFKYGQDNFYIKNAKVTSGTSKIDYDCNIDSLIDELISGLEETKEDMLEYGGSYENEVTLNDYFILNAEVKEVVNKNEFVLWDGSSDVTMVAVKLDDLDISLKENDKVAIKSRAWDLENNDYIASCTILNYQDVGVFK